MFNYKHLAILLMTLFYAVLKVHAQKSDLTAQVPDIRAEKLYAIEGYQKANDIYERVEPKNHSKETLLKIANGHRLNGDYQQAEKYYSICITSNSKPEDVFNYAQVLLSNGKCKESIPFFNLYKKASGNKNLVNVISSCDELTGFSKNAHIKVENAEGINSKWLDFCPVYYQNGLIFTSGRPNNSNTQVTDFWSNKSFSGLYFSQCKGNHKFDSPEILSWNLESRFHDGAVTFSPDGKEMYYSSNNKDGKNKKGIKDLKIYRAKLMDGVWTYMDEFPFNSDDYDNCHPALSADGNKLVFSSNMPGGSGGMDLYVCYKKNNIWSKPFNLGPQINTAGNEIFPFLDVQNQLFFSSNGLKGMGGLDIFFAKLNENEFFWSAPTNMGQPVNSIKDDLSYVTSRSGQDGYFASNREGGMGEDDIYFWTVQNDSGNADAGGLISLVIADAETLQPIDEVKVNLFDTKSDKTTLLTNPEGKIGQELDMRETKFIECEKNGYKTRLVYLTPVMVNNPAKSIVYLEHDRYQPLKGVVLNRSNDFPIENADILIKNMLTGETVSLKSNPDGSYNTILECKNDYLITVTKDDYLPNDLDLHHNELICRSDRSIVKDFHMTPYKINEKRRSLSAAFLGDESKTFEAGRTFEVKDIYYDYNKATIRPDAVKTLNKLVDLLVEFPEMEIELSSHTDSRGRDSYNQKLSQQRAESAVRFIVKHGIRPERLKAAGYGEAMLKNSCGNGVNCNEELHQQNRRTEIKILKL